MRKALLVSATLLGFMAFVPSADAFGWRGYGYYGYGGGRGCGYAGYGYGYAYRPIYAGYGWGYRGGWGRRW